MNSLDSLTTKLNSVVKLTLEIIKELDKAKKKVIFSPTNNKEDIKMTTRKDGRLMARVYIEPGKYKYIYGYNQAEVEYKVRVAKREIAEQKRKTKLNGDMSLSDYITYYFEKISKIKESSYHTYRSKIEIIQNSRVAHKKIRDLSLEDFEKILDDCDTNNSRNLVINILKTSFETIKNIGIIQYNYAVLLRNDEITEEEKIEQAESKIVHKYMPISDFEILLSESRTSLQRIAFLILYYTGVRIGELLALKYDDFEENFDTLLVTKQFSASCGSITTTKSKRSVRRIKIQKVLRDELINYKRQGKKLEFNGRRFKDALKRTLIAFKVNHGNAYNFHDFRHSFATNNFIAEKNPKVVQNELGHKSYELTINTYTHLPSLTDEEREKIKLQFAS